MFDLDRYVMDRIQNHRPKLRFHSKFSHRGSYVFSFEESPEICVCLSIAGLEHMQTSSNKASDLAVRDLLHSRFLNCVKTLRSVS